MDKDRHPTPSRGQNTPKTDRKATEQLYSSQNIGFTPRAYGARSNRDQSGIGVYPTRVDVLASWLFIPLHAPQKPQDGRNPPIRPVVPKTA